MAGDQKKVSDKLNEYADDPARPGKRIEKDDASIQRREMIDLLQSMTNALDALVYYATPSRGAALPGIEKSIGSSLTQLASGELKENSNLGEPIDYAGSVNTESEVSDNVRYTDSDEPILSPREQGYGLFSDRYAPLRNVSQARGEDQPVTRFGKWASEDEREARQDIRADNRARRDGVVQDAEAESVVQSVDDPNRFNRNRWEQGDAGQSMVALTNAAPGSDYAEVGRVGISVGPRNRRMVYRDAMSRPTAAARAQGAHTHVTGFRPGSRRDARAQAAMRAAPQLSVVPPDRYNESQIKGSELKRIVAEELSKLVESEPSEPQWQQANFIATKTGPLGRTRIYTDPTRGGGKRLARRANIGPESFSAWAAENPDPNMHMRAVNRDVEAIDPESIRGNPRTSRSITDHTNTYIRDEEGRESTDPAGYGVQRHSHASTTMFGPRSFRVLSTYEPPPVNESGQIKGSELKRIVAEELSKLVESDESDLSILDLITVEETPSLENLHQDERGWYEIVEDPTTRTTRKNYYPGIKADLEQERRLNRMLYKGGLEDLESKIPRNRNPGYVGIDDVAQGQPFQVTPKDLPSPGPQTGISSRGLSQLSREADAVRDIVAPITAAATAARTNPAALARNIANAVVAPITSPRTASVLNPAVGTPAAWARNLRAIPKNPSVLSRGLGVLGAAGTPVALAGAFDLGQGAGTGLGKAMGIVPVDPETGEARYGLYDADTWEAVGSGLAHYGGEAWDGLKSAAGWLFEDEERLNDLIREELQALMSPKKKRLITEDDSQALVQAAYERQLAADRANKGWDILMRAFGKQESGDDPTALSGAGAYGRFQIMPTMWKAWHKKAEKYYGLPEDSLKDQANNPRNQYLVARYQMQKYHDEFSGYGDHSPHGTVWGDIAAAWYAGETKVRRAYQANEAIAAGKKPTKRQQRALDWVSSRGTFRPDPKDRAAITNYCRKGLDPSRPDEVACPEEPRVGTYVDQLLSKAEAMREPQPATTPEPGPDDYIADAREAVRVPFDFYTDPTGASPPPTPSPEKEPTDSTGDPEVIVKAEPLAEPTPVDRDDKAVISQPVATNNQDDQEDEETDDVMDKYFSKAGQQAIASAGWGTPSQ